jgi:putative ABC transport system permease protein
MDQFYAKLGERFASAGAEVEIGSSFPHFYEAYTQPVESDAQRGPNASIGVSLAGSDHFKVFGIPLRGGREFGPADRLGSEPVAIVSESAARHLWPHTPAIGRRVRNPEDPNSSLGGWRTVVGVVRDVRQTYDDRDPKDIYVPYLQVPGRYASVQARSDRASPLPLTQLATVVAEMDPYIRVSGPVPVAEQDTQFVRARFVTSLLGGFAAFAAGLTLLGLYGVTAYAVQQREREIAIRVAIGATRHDVVRLFLRDGGRVLLVGIGLGLLGSLGAMKIIASQIHGVQTSDPVTLAVASALLLGTGLLATWWPLHRRSDVNLVTLLKDE